MRRRRKGENHAPPSPRRAPGARIPATRPVPDRPSPCTRFRQAVCRLSAVFRRPSPRSSCRVPTATAEGRHRRRRCARSASSPSRSSRRGPYRRRHRLVHGTVEPEARVRPRIRHRGSRGWAAARRERPRCGRPGRPAGPAERGECAARPARGLAAPTSASANSSRRASPPASTLANRGFRDHATVRFLHAPAARPQECPDHGPDGP